MKFAFCLGLLFLSRLSLATVLDPVVQKQTEKLFLAIEKGDYKKAEKAILKGALVNTFNVDGAPANRTPLSRSVKVGRVNITRLLLSYGANPDTKVPTTGMTPLMIAAKYSRGEIAGALLEYGANPNVVTPLMGRSALNIAALHNARHVVKLLLQNEKTDVNVRENLCALAVAARQGYSEIIKLMLEAKDFKTPSEICLKKAIELAVHNKHDASFELLKQF